MKIYKRTRGRVVSSRAVARIIEREFPDHTIAELAVTIGYQGEDGLRKTLYFGRLMGFDTADRILTRLGVHHLWHEDPSLLAACAFLDALPERDEVKAAYEVQRARTRRSHRIRETADCEGCGKRHKRKRTWNSKSFARFCSEECQVRAWRAAA